MSAARKILNKMLDELPDELMVNVISYTAFIKNEKNNKIFKELEEASFSSMDFWDNPIDDEVWNNA
jgi:hypothetical protein